MKEYILKESSDLVEIPRIMYTEFNGASVWWRGQANADWHLVSGVHRRNKSNRNNIFEVSANNHFIRGARVRRESCPNPNALDDWLFLMQHYGLPTRLLDWSTSILVALYFAVANKDSDLVDGAVWCLHPTQMNKFMCGTKGFFNSDDPDLINLYERAFDSSKDLKRFSHLAVLAHHHDIRMLVQSGHYTIQDNSTPLNHLQNAGKFLIKINVPADKKSYWRKSLDLLGINKRSIFPDLQSLAEYISDREFDDVE